MRKRRILWLFIMIWGMAIAAGCSSDKGEESRKIYTPSKKVAEKETNYDAKLTGVIRSMDSESDIFTVYDVESQKNMTFTYTGGTDVRNRYDMITTMDSMEIGEIVDVYYYSMSNKATRVAVSPDSFLYNDISKMKMNLIENMLNISGQNYRYDEKILVWNQGKEVGLIDLSSQDVFKIRGIGSQIYSIIVMQGHGYLRLRNYGDFIGGMIEVGYGIIVPVVENMLIVTREGDYKVEVANGDLKATETVSVQRDQETELDLSAYKAEPERIGYVRFEIEPFGANLYINGKEYEYEDPVKLNYGKHQVQVTMNGYDDFKGILTIAESTPTIAISLSEGIAQVQDDGNDASTPEPETTVTPAPSTTPDATGEDSTNIKQDDSKVDADNDKTYSDNEHTITIEQPAGASLYLNGSLVGTIPITFTKEIGTNVLILSQTGYITKSYTIEIVDDGEDVVLGFPDMIQSE